MRSSSRPETGAFDLNIMAVSHRAPLLRYFIRRGLDEEAAEDCAQEVFVRLAKANLTGVHSAEGYLFATASAVLIDRARRARVRAVEQHDPIHSVELESGEPSPARVFEGRQALERLAMILDELPERTREIFLLNRLDRLTNTQLAARYGISVSSIEKHMTKALAHLRARFRADE